MIKIFLIIFSISTIYANDLDIASNIFEKIVTSMSHQEKPKIYVYKDIKAISRNMKKFNLVESCEEAEIILLSSIKNIPATCRDKVLFGTKYRHLKNEKVVGAFFWQKGRPNILFYKNRLNKHHIKLDSSFDKYIENK